MAGFKFETQKYSRFSVNKWVGPRSNKIIIREIDTLLEINNGDVLRDMSTTYKVDAKLQRSKPAWLKFHIYIIDRTSGAQLVYLTEQYQGLCEYRIGKQIVEPVFEDIPLGFHSPNLDDVLKSINTTR